VQKSPRYGHESFMPYLVKKTRGDLMGKEKFEEALDKLEEIVRRMEAGEMTMEESLKAFEEGIKLARFCTKKLDEADRRVDLLLRQEGELVTKPFAGEEREPER